MPETYALPSSDPNAYKYDASGGDRRLCHRRPRELCRARAEAKKLEAAIDAMLADPTDETLAAARKAWVAARPAYLVTEAFRFYDGPIEALEGQINAWPMDEAFIDYVEGKPDAGIINDPAIGDLDQRDRSRATRSSDEDRRHHRLARDRVPALGPGPQRRRSGQPAGHRLPRRQGQQRPPPPLSQARHRPARRRPRADWPTHGRPATTATTPPSSSRCREREAIGRILNGMAVLAGSELMSERLAVGLDSGDQEDEHSCFSDTTHQDFVYDVKGIENVWNGTYPGGSGPG